MNEIMIGKVCKYCGKKAIAKYMCRRCYDIVYRDNNRAWVNERQNAWLKKRLEKHPELRVKINKYQRERARKNYIKKEFATECIECGDKVFAKSRCKKHYNKYTYNKNKEKHKEYYKKYREENKDKIREYQKEYQKNYERDKEYLKEYYKRKRKETN